MFLHTIGHNEWNRAISHNFTRSGETVSQYFSKVLHAIGELREDLIRPPSLETPAKIAGSRRWFPWFKVSLKINSKIDIPTFLSSKSYLTYFLLASP